ncbi:MAG: hypothetical protein AABX33_06315 [Nanoarchaeota archaeon]
MKRKKISFIQILTIFFFLYLIYQIYNLFFDIKYKLFGTLDFGVTASIFLLSSTLNVIINFILIIRLHNLKSDSILWFDIFFGYNILEMLVATAYLILAFSSINRFSTLEAIKAFGIRITVILAIIISIWIIARYYLRRDLKILKVKA